VINGGKIGEKLGKQRNYEKKKTKPNNKTGRLSAIESLHDLG